MSLEVFQGSERYKGPRPVVTIGNFDGVHLGHQFLISRTLEEAREAGARAAVQAGCLLRNGHLQLRRGVHLAAAGRDAR